MTEEAAQGHFVLAYPYGTSLRWSNGRRRWLAIDGEPLQPRTPWDGNASRFNHACQNQTVYGRWKQYGGLKILEFRAKGALEGGTELAWDYNSGGSSYTISESAARALASEGIRDSDGPMQMPRDARMSSKASSPPSRTDSNLPPGRIGRCSVAHRRPTCRRQRSYSTTVQIAQPTPRQPRDRPSRRRSRRTYRSRLTALYDGARAYLRRFRTFKFSRPNRAEA